MKEFDRLVKIVDRLRSKDGCKWDRAQRLENLRTYLLEEIYELIDAINERDREKTKEELGDVCLLLVFIARVFKEKTFFTIEDVLKKINDKLIGRHPHVFSRKKLNRTHDIVQHWVIMKAKKKNRKTLDERLPKKAPSLLLGSILFKEYRYLGNTLAEDKIIAKIEEEVKKLATSKNKKKRLVEMLMEMVKLASLEKVDLECSLRRAIFKHAKKLRYKGKIKNSCYEPSKRRWI